MPEPITIEVSVNMSLMRRYRAAINAGMNNASTNKVRKAFHQWELMYKTWSRRRYDRLSKSKGSGEWPDLSPVTKERRRKPTGRKRRSFAILRDTGTMFQSFQPSLGRTGGVEGKQIKNGVSVTIRGGARHPNAPLSVGELMIVHHEGKGHVPARTLLVKPDTDLNRRMVKIMDKALRDLDRDLS